MSEEDLENIKLLSSKFRVEQEGLCKMTDAEKNELERLRNLFDTIDANVGKTIYYMHDFLGVDFIDIAKIINFTYGSTRTRYYETKFILLTL